MEGALTGTSGMLFVCLCSVVWLPGLRGVGSCGGCHGLRSSLGLLGLFVFSFFLKVLIGRVQLNIIENRNKKTQGAGWCLVQTCPPSVFFVPWKSTIFNLLPIAKFTTLRGPVQSSLELPGAKNGTQNSRAIEDHCMIDQISETSMRDHGASGLSFSFFKRQSIGRSSPARFFFVHIIVMDLPATFKAF